MEENKKIAILEDVLIHLKKDQEYCKRNDDYLDGLCPIFRKFDCCISDFPEVMALKPKKMYYHMYWFDTDPNNNQRIELIEKVLTDLKTK
jgi:hypothetical protein